MEHFRLGNIMRKGLFWNCLKENAGKKNIFKEINSTKEEMWTIVMTKHGNKEKSQ